MRYQDYEGEWPWPNFKPKEVACKHCGELWEGDKPMPKWFHESMEALQYLRDLWGKPIIINSGHRCAEHNTEVGGAPSSQHLRIAFDCRIAKEDQREFKELAEEAGFRGIGYYSNFIHIDMGPRRTWLGKY